MSSLPSSVWKLSAEAVGAALDAACCVQLSLMAFLSLMMTLRIRREKAYPEVFSVSEPKEGSCNSQGGLMGGDSGATCATRSWPLRGAASGGRGEAFEKAGIEIRVKL